MSRGGRGVAAALVLLVGVLVGTLTPAAGDEGPLFGGLQHVATERVSARVQVATFRSPALVDAAQVRILLPEGYDPSGATRYPVLYLLHGGGGSSTRWLEAGDAEDITAGSPLIVVMPDGGPFGFYADWWNFGLSGGPRWETFHLSQLVPWVDATYPTIGTRDGRAVAGESMGGLGAIHYAAKRPDLFTAALSFSGAVDTNLFVAPPIVEVAALAEGLHVPAATFGPRLTDEIRWRGHNPVDLAGNLDGVFLKLDVGTGEAGGPVAGGGDPVEWAMHQMGTALHERLDAFGIDHVWQPGPGCHCWFQWQDDLREGLPLLMERFADPVPPPSPFRYTSIDPGYEVYGWRVDIARPAVELSELVDAGPGGFSLRGSGTARVRTAALFDPGQVVEVIVADAGGSARSTIAADGEGRLTVPVSLGPGNPLQQLSPAGRLWALGQGLSEAAWPSVIATVRFERVPSVGPLTPEAVPPADAEPGRSAGRLPATGRDATLPLVLGALALAGAAALRRTGLRPSR